jgi:hypothetical protein
VHRLRRSWRWGVVAGVGVVLLLLPLSIASRPTDTPSIVPEALAQLILRTVDTPYQGYVSARGGLQFPDIPRADEAAKLLGEPSSLRAWVDGPSSWRVDELTVTGEHDTYKNGGTLWTWDSQEHRARRLADSSAVRLPRSFDLLPPELARRLLAGAEPAELQPIGARRVAGRGAVGVRIVPASADTIVGFVDVWADPSTGLALQVEVTPRGATHPSFVTRFLEVSFRQPAASTLSFTPPANANIADSNSGLDLVQAADQFQQASLPDALAGTSRTTAKASAVATYGSGFTVVTVVRARRRDSDNLLGAAVPASTRPWGGTARVLSTPLANIMAITTSRATYVVSGAVTIDVLDRYAQAISSGGAL